MSEIHKTQDHKLNLFNIKLLYMLPEELYLQVPMLHVPVMYHIKHDEKLINNT